MEHLAGETLAQRLRRGPLPLAQALGVAAQIAEALDAAHKHGIIHRDLKPGNVMLTTGGAGRSGATSAKPLDFGLAKAVDPNGGRGFSPGGHAGSQDPASMELANSPTRTAPVTARETILGTLPYMAPEQLEGKEADARTDLWAQTYDRDLSDVLILLSEVSRAIAGEVQATLTPGRTNGPLPGPGTITRVRPEAYEAYLRGRREFYSVQSPGEVGRALPFFEEAARLDPTFAAAWSAIAGAQAARSFPSFRFAHRVIGDTLWKQGRYEDSLPELEQSFANDTELWTVFERAFRAAGPRAAKRALADRTVERARTGPANPVEVASAPVTTRPSPLRLRTRIRVDNPDGAGRVRTVAGPSRP
jgi:hypothetical protein